MPSLMARAPCPSGTRPIASYSISSAMVKQSCVSTNERSDSVMPACASARCQACVQPSNLRISRLAIGRKSCTCCAARNATALSICNAVSTSVSTIAAAPSETSEQDAGGLRSDGTQALMHRRRAGCAGILHPRGALEAQVVGGLEYQRSRKILLREARVEVAEHDLVDVGWRDSGIGQRIDGNAY